MFYKILQTFSNAQLSYVFIEDKKLSKSLTEVKKEVWEHVGEGAERTVQYLTAKLDEITAKKTPTPKTKKKEKAKQELAQPTSN